MSHSWQSKRGAETPTYHRAEAKELRKVHQHPFKELLYRWFSPNSRVKTPALVGQEGRKLGSLKTITAWVWKVLHRLTCWNSWLPDGTGVIEPLWVLGQLEAGH